MIIRGPLIRKASLTALAGAVGLLSVSPGWSSCPPMGGKPGSQGGDTGAADRMRQEAGQAAGQDSNNGGVPGSGGSATAPEDLSGQITALAGAQAASQLGQEGGQQPVTTSALDGAQAGAQIGIDAGGPATTDPGAQAEGDADAVVTVAPTAQAGAGRVVVSPEARDAFCHYLSGLLPSLKADPSMDFSDDARLSLDQVTGLRPETVDFLIKTRQKQLDEVNAERRALARRIGRPPVLAQDPMLDWLMRYQVAQLSGIDVQVAKDAFDGQTAAMSRQYQQTFDRIRNIETNMTSLRCPGWDGL